MNSNVTKYGKQAVVVIFAVALVMMLTVTVAPAKADNLYFCNGCTSAPSGDPDILTNVSGPAGFQVGFSGNKSSVSPLMIIIGTYDGAPAPTITVGATSFTPGGAAIYGWNGAEGVNFTSGDAYAALGFTPLSGGPSESFGQWSGAATANSLAAPTKYTLYVYELSGVAFPGTSPDTITMSLTGGTEGDMIVGYACETAPDPTTGLCHTGKDGNTPFTTAGFDDQPGTPTPEPGSLVLFATGLFGFAGLVRKRMAK